MLPVGWPWAPLNFRLKIVWRFVVMKKCNLASREFLKVVQMKVYILLSCPRKFCEIQPENKALELIWSCRHDKDSAEIWGKPSKNPAYGRHWLTGRVRIVEPKSTIFETFFLAFLDTFFTFWVYFAFGAKWEVACHSQAYLKFCAWTIHEFNLD